MKNICVIFGGKSVENEVSVITANQVLQNIDKGKYKIFPVYIDKKGCFWTGKNYDKIETFKFFKPKNHHQIIFQANSGGIFIKKKFVKIDCCLVCCHGTGGEDGSLQGLLNIINVPYTCCGVEASAVCMNKILMKKLFQYYNLPITEYQIINKDTYKLLDNADIKIKYPIFVKPANLGSSVGINKCNNFEQVQNAINIAFYFDNQVLLEQGVENLVEYNCSTMKINNKIEASQIEQPHAWSEFLNFDDKYIRKGKKFGRKINQAKIGIRLEQKIKDMAIFVHKELGLEGVVRTDFLYDKVNKKLYINEINTIPGSLSYYLWKSHKISFKDLITNLIDDAIERKHKFENVITSYNSKIFDKHIKT